MKNQNNDQFRSAAYGLLALSVGTLAHAQDVSSTDEETFELSPFVVTVDGDKGYRAGATLAGSRLATSLEDTPVALSVMTAEFLSDIGADDVNSALRYGLNAGNDINGGASSGAGAITGNGITGREFNFQIRGYRSVAATRDYFPTSLASDSFNIERVEVARGPNSLIYGVGGQGGVVNIQVKKASDQKDSTTLGTKFGSYGLQRYTVDTNRVLIEDKLGVRFNYLNQKEDGWKDFAKNDQERYALAATFRASENTTVRFNMEMGELDQNRVRPWMPYDATAQWEYNGAHYFDYGTGESPWEDGDDNYTQKRDNLPQAGYWGFGTNPGSNGLPDYIAPGNPDGFERRSHHLGTPNVLMTTGPLAGKYLHVGSREEGARYYRISGGPQTVSDVPPFVDDLSIIPLGSNPMGSGAGQLNDYDTFGISLDQKIGQNLNVNLTINESTTKRRNRNSMSFNEAKYDYDLMSTLPTFNNDGTYNATLAPAHGARGEPGAGNGTLIFDAMINNPMVGKSLMVAKPDETFSTQTQDDIRISASYDLDLGERAGKHTLMAFAQSSKSGNESEKFTETNISPNRPRADRWFDDQNFPGRAFHVDYHSPNLSERGLADPWANPLPDSILWGEDPSLQYEFQDGWVRSGLGKGKLEIESMAFAVQSNLLNNNLITTAGVRRDDVSILSWGSETDSFGERIGLIDPTGDQGESGDTYSLGFVYHVPQVDWLSVFANKSTNFATQYGSTRFEDEVNRTDLEIGALKGTGQDFGVKLNFNDKVFATVAYYEVTQHNAVGGGYTNNVPIYINALWTAIDNAAAGRTDPSDPLWEKDTSNPNGHKVGGSETKSQISTGIEFELTANPTENWRVSFNYSDGENVVSNLGTGLSAYLDKHRDTWMAQADIFYDFGTAPGNLGANKVGDLVAALDDALAFRRAGEGLGEVNSPSKSANLFTAYSFNEGGFKGLTLGAGANYKGESILGIFPGEEGVSLPEAYWGGGYTLYNAMASYEFKWGEKTDVRIQLNIDNLQDNNDKQILAASYNENLDEIQYYYHFLEPRSYTVSANFSF